MAKAWNKIDPERIRKAAQTYRTSQDAAQALGITYQAFNRICRREGIPQPKERKAGK